MTFGSPADDVPADQGRVLDHTHRVRENVSVDSLQDYLPLGPVIGELRDEQPAGGPGQTRDATFARCLARNTMAASFQMTWWAISLLRRIETCCSNSSFFTFQEKF